MIQKTGDRQMNYNVNEVFFITGGELKGTKNPM